MADLGHQMTDEMLEQLEKKIAREYALASKEMRKKLRDYLEKDEEKRLEQKALLDAGKISRKEYREWCYRHKMMGQQWRDMKNVLAEDLQSARAIATKIARDQMADVYALNANYATYQLEHDFGIDTGFTLYNHDTAELLMREENLQLMPPPSEKLAKQIARDKALQWDYTKIQSAVLQGVLQGESPFDVAKRLQGVAQMDYNSAVRYARTMTTSAQNAGRYEAYRRADKLGVDLTIEWQATLDGRTRHDHRLMHGQRRNVDEPFKLPSGQEILYPADSRGDSYELQGEIWNCRCTLLSWVKGYESDTVKDSPKMGGMSFEEWQHAKEPKKQTPEQPAFVSRFKPAESIKEAEEFAKQFCSSSQFGAVGVNYDGVDLDVANRINKTLVDLFDEFDVKPFGGIIAPAGNTKEGKMIKDATAAYSPVRHSFLVNRKAFGSSKKAAAFFEKERAAFLDIMEHPERYDFSRANSTVKRVLSAGKMSGRTTVPDTIESALYHEFGHSLEKQLRKADNYGAILRNMDDFAPLISGYATTETSEYIAESFASWRLGEGLIDPNLARAFEALRRRR